jgi:hypothetical protein
MVTLEVISTSIKKRLEQEKLLMVELGEINLSIKRLEQEELLIVKLEVISPSIKRLEEQKLQMVKSFY